MSPRKNPANNQTQHWVIAQVSGLTRRNPFIISQLVVRWAVVVSFSGLFADLYWNILELLTHQLKSLE